MQVTDIRLNLMNREGSVKAIGSFSLDNAFAVRGIRVMEDKNGHNFVSFPSREKSNGEYEDVAFPISKESYRNITTAIVAEYKNLKEQEQNQSQNQSQAQSHQEAVTDSEAAEEQVKQTQPEAKSTPKKGKSR